MNIISIIQLVTVLINSTDRLQQPYVRAQQAIAIAIASSKRARKMTDVTSIDGQRQARIGKMYHTKLRREQKKRARTEKRARVRQRMLEASSNKVCHHY